MKSTDNSKGLWVYPPRSLSEKIDSTTVTVIRTTVKGDLKINHYYNLTRETRRRIERLSYSDSATVRVLFSESGLADGTVPSFVIRMYKKER